MPLAEPVKKNRRIQAARDGSPIRLQAPHNLGVDLHGRAELPDFFLKPLALRQKRGRAAAPAVADRNLFRRVMPGAALRVGPIMGYGDE